MYLSDLNLGESKDSLHYNKTAKKPRKSFTTKLLGQKAIKSLMNTSIGHNKSFYCYECPICGKFHIKEKHW